MWSQKSRNILFPLVTVVTEFILAAVFRFMKDREGCETFEATMVMVEVEPRALVKTSGTDFGQD